MTLLIVILAFLFLRPIPPRPVIVDGDTIMMRGRRWRLAGFDSPETNQPGGAAATRRLREILAEGWSLGIIVGVDAWRRPLAIVVTRRGPLSWRMIAAGHAHATGILGLPFVLVARLARRGIWEGRHEVVNPAKWRRDHPTIYGAPPRRTPRLRFDYDSRKGLRLPGGFRLP